MKVNTFLRIALPSIVVILITCPAIADISTFQQGTNGYAGVQDTSIRWAFTKDYGDTPELDLDHGGDNGAYEMWRTNGGRTSVLEVGNFYQQDLGSIGGGILTVEAGPTYRYSRMFIRFRDVFGTDSGQVPPDADIRSATLRLYNTQDLGAEESAGRAFLGSTIRLQGPGTVIESVPHTPALPKLNAGRIAIYPLLVPITYGFDDGTATKGRVTAFQKKLGRVDWAMGDTCPYGRNTLNNPAGMAFACGPIDGAEFDASHPGAIDSFQDATEGSHDFDVSGMLDFLTGDGLYLTGYNPPDQIPTMQINYGQAYRSSEFGDAYDSDGNLVTGATAADIATRPMLVVDFIPEPATFTIIGLGSLTLLRRRRVR